MAQISASKYLPIRVMSAERSFIKTNRVSTTQAYFRRAEALRALLQSSNGSGGGGGGGGGRKPGKFSDVVADYCHCHKLKQNLESFCLAIILAVNHSEPPPPPPPSPSLPLFFTVFSILNIHILC